MDVNKKNRIESCVIPPGLFKYGIHKPQYRVTNLRQQTTHDVLGLDTTDKPVENLRNYPKDAVEVNQADWIYEIPNPLPFKGRTFIDKEWADASAKDLNRIALPSPQKVSLTKFIVENNLDEDLLTKMPPPLLLALATSSTDENDLVRLAELSCEFVHFTGNKLGLRYRISSEGTPRAIIHDFHLFEAVANNPHLPDNYKTAMVLRPGAQGGSEIVGEWPVQSGSHVYEYLRRNSYIAGGHYAANMSEDAIRYNTGELNSSDMKGLRHLYYQRTFIRLAEDLAIPLQQYHGILTADELESLRLLVLEQIQQQQYSSSCLWGWNYGFDYAPTGYRLHASHQQIHQQYALIPNEVDLYHQGTGDVQGKLSAYSCGDLVAEVIKGYNQQYNSSFFDDYLRAIATNKRMDDRSDLDESLIVWQDEHAMLFVPKAQTSQWELQLMTLPDQSGNFPGNIVECSRQQRESLDRGILTAQRSLNGLGGKMVTSIEYSKRIGEKDDLRQPLLYAFLPRLPESPGAFSEAQLRFINGHYPEDFATACRRALSQQ